MSLFPNFRTYPKNQVTAVSFLTKTLIPDRHSYNEWLSLDIILPGQWTAVCTEVLFCTVEQGYRKHLIMFVCITILQYRHHKVETNYSLNLL